MDKVYYLVFLSFFISNILGLYRMSGKEKGEKPERERSGRSRRESKVDNGAEGRTHTDSSIGVV